MKTKITKTAEEKKVTKGKAGERTPTFGSAKCDATFVFLKSDT